MAYARVGVHRLHRWMGLGCAAVFFSTAATGVLLMFQREVNLTGAARLTTGPTADNGSLPGIDAVLAGSRSDPAGRVPISLTPPPDRFHAWQLVTVPGSGNSEGAVIESVDASSGRVLSNRKVRDAAATILLRLHMSLFSGAPGHVIVLIMAVGIITLAVSGFTMLRARWRTFLSNPLRTRDRWRALHRWTGASGAAVLLVWGVTGSLLIGRVVVEDWAATVARPTVALPLGLPIEAFIERAEARPHRIDDRSSGEIYGIGLPTSVSPDVDITFLHREAAPWRKYSHVRLDRRSGEVLGQADSAEESGWARVMAAADSIHKGQSDPMAVHYAYAVAVLFPLILVVTGPAAWLSRRWRSRRAGERHATA